jgi:OmpA-OmpF porin, OOP family
MPQFVPILDEAAQTLKDNPDINVSVEGHTDSIGSDEYNQRLSDRRAQIVTIFPPTNSIHSPGRKTPASAML